jgi:hypothetical protein
MKRKLILGTAFIFVLGMMSCSSPLSMKKAAKDVIITCNPAQLEIKGNAIEAEWTATFPVKYFHKKAGLQLLPVLVYEGGEVAAPVKRLQGEKVLDNYEVINKANGGKASQKVKFDYVPGMEKSRLELRAKLVHKTKEYDFDEPYVLAYGAKSAALLTDKSGATELQADSYKKFTLRQQDAEIKYELNKSDVKKAQISKDDIKELKAFVDNAVADGKKVEYQGLEISSYASPEGALSRNEVLSEERGKTANTAFDKLYTKKETKPAGPVELKHTAEDWDGFQKLVSESNLDDKNLVLRVLSMYQDPVVREKEIRNMSKVFTILEDKVLPELRRSVITAKVKVNNYSDEELIALVGNSGINNLDVEALLYAATLFNDNDTKALIYKKAAEKYEDERAINNYAAVLLKQGKTEEANKVLASARKKSNELQNNAGIAALRSGNTDEAAKAFSQSNSAAAKENLAAVSILKGDYKAAATALEGTNTFNEALAKYLNNNVSGAKSVLDKVKDETGKASYLKAVIAAEEGNSNNVTSNLKDAFAKDASLKTKALKDIAFEKVQNLIP